MTSDDLAKLSPDQKCIKIAEACGADDIRSDDGLAFRPSAYWPLECSRMLDNCYPQKSDERTGKLIAFVPDYLNDLNAMHEAIMAQTPAFRKAMRLRLYALTDQMSAHFADAPTMADEFLLTLP